MRKLTPYYDSYRRNPDINCSAWLRLKLNTKMGLNPTTLHHTTPPVTFRVLQDKLGSWNFAQTLIRPTRLKNRTHFYPNQPHLNLSLRGKLKTPKVFLSWTHLISVLLENFCQTPVQSKSVGLGVDFVLPLSQQEQPSQKSTRRKCTTDLKFGS